MSCVDAIRPIRNRMRKFEYASVLNQISAYLQVDAGGNDNLAPRLPWVAERLALWTLRDKPHLYGRVPMQLADLIRCMNEAWNAMDTAIEWTRQGNPIGLFVRSVLLAQAPHQTAVGFGAFARQINLLNRLDPASRLSRALEASVGMATNDYLQLAVFFWLRDEGRTHEVFERSYWQVLTNAFGPSNLHSFLKTIFKSRESVCNEMGQESQNGPDRRAARKMACYQHCLQPKPRQSGHAQWQDKIGRGLSRGCSPGRESRCKYRPCRIATRGTRSERPAPRQNHRKEAVPYGSSGLQVHRLLRWAGEKTPSVGSESFGQLACH